MGTSSPDGEPASPPASSWPPSSWLHSPHHYHVLALDGVICGDVERGVRFHEATGLGARDAEALGRTVQRRVLRWFARRELLDPATAADMRIWRGTGGFSVDGSVRIEGQDRAGLERLVRYCARGPLALERLYAPADIGALTSPEARLIYRLPEPDVHGRQALRLTPLELLQRLARLVPPPRIHRWSDLDQSPAFDLAAPEPIPEYEFDQSPPHDWEI